MKFYDKTTFKYQLKPTVKIEEIFIQIDSGYNTWKTKPQSSSIKNKSLILKHQFKTNGFYDIYLYMHNDLISTYTVKVKN